MSVIGLCYWGEAGVSHSQIFVNPPPIAAPEIFSKNTLMINTLLKKATETFNKPTVSQPISQPEPTPEPTPEPLLPAGRETIPHRKDTGGPTTVAGYTQGDEVTAVVARKECPHPKMLFIEVPDWEGLAITYVQDKRDWRTGDRMKVKFARMRPDYTLEFDGPKGPHRNKFGRRA